MRIYIYILITVAQLLDIYIIYSIHTYILYMIYMYIYIVHYLISLLRLPWKMIIKKEKKIEKAHDTIIQPYS